MLHWFAIVANHWPNDPLNPMVGNIGAMESILEGQPFDLRKLQWLSILASHYLVAPNHRSGLGSSQQTLVNSYENRTYRWSMMLDMDIKV